MGNVLRVRYVFCNCLPFFQFLTFERISDLQKKKQTKKLPENSHMLFLCTLHICPHALILRNHGNIIKPRKLMLMQYYELIASYSNLAQTSSLLTYCIQSPCHLSHLTSETVSQLSWSFMILTLLKSTGLLACRMTHNLRLSDVPLD